MPPTLANGKICYIEMPTTDIARSADFLQTRLRLEHPETAGITDAPRNPPAERDARAKRRFSLDASALERNGCESRPCLARIVPSCHPRN